MVWVEMLELPSFSSQVKHQTNPSAIRRRRRKETRERNGAKHLIPILKSHRAFTRRFFLLPFLEVPGNCSSAPSSYIGHTLPNRRIQFHILLHRRIESIALFIVDAFGVIIGLDYRQKLPITISRSDAPTGAGV